MTQQLILVKYVMQHPEEKLQFLTHVHLTLKL